MRAKRRTACCGWSGLDGSRRRAGRGPSARPAAAARDRPRARAPPRLLLLDEPAAGLNSAETAELADDAAADTRHGCHASWS